MTVLALDPRQTTNAQRVADLARLGYLPEPVIDPTYGLGRMWTRYRPERLTALDLDPWRGVTLADVRALPFPDDAFASALYDPPYRLGGTPTTRHPGGHDDRYGIDRYRSISEVYALIEAGTVELERVVRPGGFLIVKCADQVSSGRVQWQAQSVARWMAEILGLDVVDQLHLLARRGQPSGTRQLHARRNLSTFIVAQLPRRRT